MPVAQSSRRFLAGLVALTLFAWLLREYFVLVSIVDVPIRGDVREYVAYAWNLVHHGVFSRAEPGTEPVPDGFRGPGYPWLIAAAMRLRPQGDGWYWAVLHVQALVGAATVTATTLLARRWLATGWALFAGLLVALWPHHIAATGALLSEVVFGGALMVGLAFDAKANDSVRGDGWAAGAGAAFGYAWLVNPLVTFLPPLLAVCGWRIGRRRSAALMLLVFALPIAAWGLRNAALPDGGSGDRAKINFVEGSWPQYHLAWASSSTNAISGQIMQAINDEETLIKRDTSAGLHAVATRLSADPAYYARWYLLRKPWLLWDWDIRMGAGGVYFHVVRNSPLDSHPVLRASTALLKWANPLLFAFATVAALALLVRMFMGRLLPFAPLAVALAFLYFTALHAVLQAEPRYSIPYRPLEALLATTTLAWLIESARRRLARSEASSP